MLWLSLQPSQLLFSGDSIFVLGPACLLCTLQHPWLKDHVGTLTFPLELRQHICFLRCIVFACVYISHCSWFLTYANREVVHRMRRVDE